MATELRKSDLKSRHELFRGENSVPSKFYSSKHRERSRDEIKSKHPDKRHSRKKHTDSKYRSNKSSIHDQQRRRRRSKGHAKHLSNNHEPMLNRHKYSKLIQIETHPNGGASVVHLFQEEFQMLSSDEIKELAKEFFKVVFHEDENGCAHHVMGIIHNAANYLPDLLDYMANNHGKVTVENGILGCPSGTQTTTMAQYRDEVYKKYSFGTVRYGPMLQISLVGTAKDEFGGFFPDLLSKLEENIFLKMTMPWGPLSILQMETPSESNDGPVLWIRPGEQFVPIADCGMGKTIGGTESQDYLFKDRIRVHADHVSHGLSMLATATAGILKAVNCGEKPTVRRIMKDVVAFHAADFDDLVKKFEMDLHKPPTTQSKQWINDAKLNQLRREKIEYAKIPLCDGDIYFLPRNVIHQFRTISASTTISWHVRLQQYYQKPPNVSSVQLLRPINFPAQSNPQSEHSKEASRQHHYRYHGHGHHHERTYKKSHSSRHGKRYSKMPKSNSGMSSSEHRCSPEKYDEKEESSMELSWDSIKTYASFLDPID